MANRVKLTAAVVLVLITFPVGHWLRHARPWESVTQRVHRLCRDCGLGTDGIDQLIADARNATLTREQKLELFYQQFERRADAELCEDCALAVLNAAGRMSAEP